jgi:hypothetical protein
MHNTDRGLTLPTVHTMNRIIAGFCSDVVNEPLSFFSEADLQGLLFARLIREFPVLVETSYAKGPESKGMYTTGLVHREYGVGGSRRIDIAVFSQKDVARIDGPGLKIGRQYMIPQFGVELSTEKTLGTEAHIRRDLAKLSLVNERGYLVHFFRDVTRADTGTRSRENTEGKLETIFRRPVSAASAPDKVRILCFLLRLARTHRKIYGKCELYLPLERMWKKVNLQNIKHQVLDLL